MAASARVTEGEPTARTLQPVTEAAPSSPRPATAAALPEAREIQARLLAARVRNSLERSWRRVSAQGDFSLAPGRILQSLLDRRCGLVERHAEELRAWSQQLGLEGTRGAELCRGLLFASLRERLALPDDVTPEFLWSRLEQVDAAYERLVVQEASSSSERGYFAALERFREERRRLLGPELDARLFGLSDDVLLLPSRVDTLLGSPGASVEQNVATWQAELRRIEREHGVRLSEVMEPVELARQELRLRESSGPLDEAARRAVLERQAGAEAASRELAFRHEQRERAERLSAFNAEREQLLAKLRGEGLTPEQLLERMPEIDRSLFEKYHLQ
ncbi:hypothetical protein [Hyalangium gracile]|uniref:hypothetical protein n=1 Tax=Hyalangium gracile TaxID=394092 RepID=UPI001CCA290F|nr:hypothetical protein [Hyalangium gracile]